MKNKNLILTVLLTVFVVAITVFIFANSMADGESSTNFSNRIIDWFFLRKLLDNEIVQLVVRKAAHMIEFAALGSFVMGLSLHLHQNYRKSFYGYSFFYVLSVAVIDEHIQNFSSGRTSATSDVLLDFLGAVIGFFLVCLIYIIIKKCKKKAKHFDNPHILSMPAIIFRGCGHFFIYFPRQISQL